MFTIKFQPWALAALFDLNMLSITDCVVSIEKELEKTLQFVIDVAISKKEFDEKKSLIEDWFLKEYLTKFKNETKIQITIQSIIESNGIKPINEIVNKLSISERTLERHFKTSIGLSPKFYSRIIRLSHVFELAQKNKRIGLIFLFKVDFIINLILLKISKNLPEKNHPNMAS